ncbi:MAG: transcriptional repressor [Chloroflexi bacterium]|nr:transcriptional repressor [Chloroflexota bacterium]
MTAPREIILSVIAQSSDHLSAEEILKRARRADPRLNKSVVYRNLSLLTSLGLISYTNLGNGRSEYELHRHPHHHHLVCRNCHRIFEFAPQTFARLERELNAAYGFAADLDHLAIFGLCAKCRAKKNMGGHHPHKL